MSPSAPEVVELFNKLESNNPQDVLSAKTKFADMFNAIKESSLVYELIEYYYSTGSMRAVEILIKAPVPHERYIFDRIDEGIRSPSKCGALGLLGHIVRRQPSWLHKITKQSLFRDLLQLLKHEKDVVTLMSGLLVLITLVPMIPTLISPFFQDMFDIFGRLAAWDSDKASESLDGHREHLQVGLYGLFFNFYGMFPCNFVDYLRREYTKRENNEIFKHTVKPILENVKIHPLLITASKNAETDNARWKKMEHHDVVVECRRFSSESTHKQRGMDSDDSRFRSRCGTDVSSLLTSTVSQFQTSKSSNSTPNLTESQTLTKTTITTMSSDPASVAVISRKCESIIPGGENWFSLSDACGAASTLSAPQTPLPLQMNTYQDTPISHTPVSQIPMTSKQQDSGSPPEAAIEATPENTPIKDTRQRFNFPNNSPAVRALGSRLSQPQPHQVYQPHLSSSHSQPPSPLKKEPSPFSRMSSVESSSTMDQQEARKDHYIHQQYKINRVLQDRSQQTSENYMSSPQKQSSSPLKKINLRDGSNLAGFVPSVPNSPVPLGTAAPVSGSTDWPLAKPKPHKDGVPFHTVLASEATSMHLVHSIESDNKEDKEIIELFGTGMRATSVTRDVISSNDSEIKASVSRLQQDPDGQEDFENHWAEDEMACEGDVTQCTERKHGLHMPQSTSMVEFARRIKRFRYHSQCVPEPTPGSITRSIETSIEDGKFLSNKLQRARSFPDFKSPRMTDFNYDNTEKVQDKDLSVIQQAVTFENGNITGMDLKKERRTNETQTVDVWPLTYEFMFTDVLQNFYEQSAKSNEMESAEEKCQMDFSPYGQVDKYIELLAQNKLDKKPKDEVEHLRQQLQLLQMELLFERHRREVHAMRNRRLLGRSRKNRAAEEQNQALKQQITSLQVEADELRFQVRRQKDNMLIMEQKHQDNAKYWQQQLYLRDAEIQKERQEKEQLNTLLLEQRSISNEASSDVQHLHAALFDVSQQLQKALRKSETSDQLLECVKRMQREFIICGESNARYREALAMLPPKTDALVNRVTQQFKDQLLNSQMLLQSQTAKVEYLQARETELESTISNKDQSLQELKKQLHLVKEEYSERLKVVEDKYQSIKRINQRMEAHCLELLRQAPQSPQAISRDLTSGLSPQSSPLSASLASSEGHGAMLASRVDDIRNLQVIVNAHETIEESTSNSVNNVAFETDNN